MNKLPPQALLREWLDYNPETGLFYWVKEPRPCRPLIGQKAGSEKQYKLIHVRGYGLVGAHRLAWIWCNGNIPGGVEVDHIDGNPANNAISNLRLASSSQQKMNKGVQSNNRAGLKGAFYHACRKGKKWRSQIKVDSRLLFIGYFDTAEEAHTAYLAAANKHFGRFACNQAERLTRSAA